MINKETARKIGKYLCRVLIVILITIAMTAATLYGVLFVLTKGPSPTASKLFVKTVKETSAGGFLADMFFTKAEIDEIISVKSSEIDESETVDPSLIRIPDKPEDSKPADSSGKTDNQTDVPDTDEHETSVPIQDDPDDGIEIIDIIGGAYKGKMLIVKEPKRVFIGIPPEGYGENKWGLTVKKMVNYYGAVAGTNAGGFFDPDGKGTGGIPEGYVIYEGELVWGARNIAYSIVGFDDNGLLHVGRMTAERALALGMKYAVCFGPSLIINGVPCNENYDLGGGVNPRTVVGQREDGAVLILVINGRQIDSIGASYDDLIDIMLEHGAVNAGNLDGGSSSILMYEGEYQTKSAYLFGERIVPNAILVK